jgi:hypothetical protein
MSETKTSQSQQIKDGWNKIVEEQLGRVSGFCDELAKLEAKRDEQLVQAVDEAARMTKESLAYFGALSAEWRKLSLEATRRATSWMTLGGA